MRSSIAHSPDSVKQSHEKKGKLKMSPQNQTTNKAEETKPKRPLKKSKSSAALSKPSNSRIAMGVAAAFGGSLVAVSWLGLGPVVIAGTAGYLTYQGMTRKLS
jgi:hypothetical protein